jgi:hypothetical protein
MTETLAAAVDRLRGQPVTVIVDRDDPDARMTGLLVDVDEYGECVLETPEGRRHGWPTLEIVPVDDVKGWSMYDVEGDGS